jgi:hypothetical protein
MISCKNSSGLMDGQTAPFLRRLGKSSGNDFKKFVGFLALAGV